MEKTLLKITTSALKRVSMSFVSCVGLLVIAGLASNILFLYLLSFSTISVGIDAWGLRVDIVNIVEIKEVE